MKKCNDCDVNQANIHLTQIMQGETTVLHLCEECAKKRGINVSLAAGAPAASVPQPEAAQTEVICPHCGLRFSEFKTKGWLGCPDCYGAFEKQIDELLVRVHGSCVHRGKRYGQGAPGDGDVGDLRARLAAAVKNEEFELAAQIRDAINGMSARSDHLESNVERT